MNLSWKIEYVLSDLSWTIENSLQDFWQNLLMGSSFGRKNMYLDHPESKKQASLPKMTIRWADAPTYPGKGFDSFPLELADGFFMPGEILQCAPNIAVRIMRTPIAVGSMYCYEVRLDTKDPNAYLPEQYLKPGILWCLRTGNLNSITLGKTTRHWPILD